MKKTLPLALLVLSPNLALAQSNDEDATTPAPKEAVTAPEPTPTIQTTGDTGSDFMDVRLNLTLTNENVFAEPGETRPSIPGWRFGVPNSLGTLFFDNYDTRFSGYETLSHLVLYKKIDSGHHETEGAWVMRINNLAQDRLDLSDAGTYLRYAYWFDETRQNPARLSVTAFPTSSDRFRLGYSYRLSWGGSNEYRRSNLSVPGVKVQYDWNRGYAFIGGKSAVLLNRATAEEESSFGLLAGAGYDFSDMVRWEVNGGVFDRGNNVLPDVNTQKVILYGASTQLSIHKGAPIGSSIDFALYRNDRARIQELFRREVYEGGLSWGVASEATVIGQTLKDPAVPGGTTTQFGWAADINGRVKYNRWRFQLDVQARDAAFLLHEVPSDPAYQAFPEDYESSPNIFAAIGGDYAFETTPVTAGFIFGVDKPATITTPIGAIAGDEMATTTVNVLRSGLGEPITLLPGEKALPQWAVKHILRMDLSENFATILDAYYSYDPNQIRSVREEGLQGRSMREFGQFHQLGFNVTLQARF